MIAYLNTVFGGWLDWHIVGSPGGLAGGSGSDPGRAAIGRASAVGLGIAGPLFLLDLGQDVAHLLNAAPLTLHHSAFIL